MNNYDDIIDLPHHVSSVHPPMTVYARAAQFAPFAALDGYGEAVESAAEAFSENAENGNLTYLAEDYDT